MQKNLTIVAVDTANHQLTARAIEQTVKVTNAARVLVLSDQDIYPGSEWHQIEPISQIEYSRVVLKDLAPLVTTDHYMVVQYDGMPIDSTKWQDAFLDYDYIGAPWPWHPDGHQVGNGGFSIRSRRLAELCQDPRVVFNPPGYGPDNFMEDTHICHLYRDLLASQGMTWAPTSLAREFSAEIPAGRLPTYGFHGTLCLPYYLDDSHMEFYINTMRDEQFMSVTHRRLVFGLYLSARWDLLELIMDRASQVDPEFKTRLLAQIASEQYHYANLTVEDIAELLINY